MISKRTLQLAAECITGQRSNMKQLAFDANQYKMLGNKDCEKEFTAYQQLAEALREIERELSQGRMEI